MGYIEYVTLIVIVGLLLGLSVGIYWQSLRQMMVASGAMALLAAYIFAVSVNMGFSFCFALIITCILIIVINLIFVKLGGNVSRSEFLLFGLALSEIVKRLAFELEFITGGVNGLSISDKYYINNKYLIIIDLLLLLFVLLSIWWFLKMPVGISYRLVGASPQAAKYFGINQKKIETISVAMAGIICSACGVIYILFVRYIHPDDFGFDYALSALVIGLSVRPKQLLVDIISLTFIMFGLREVLRLIGDSSIRFAGYDILIGILIIVIAFRLDKSIEIKND